MTTFRIIAGRLVIEKDPDAVLDYGFNLVDWLEEVSDTLDSLQVTGVGVTVDSSFISGTRIVAFISGGVVGEPASATFRYTTTGGRTDDRTMHFRITQR